jgi:hypothetical protein
LSLRNGERLAFVRMTLIFPTGRAEAGGPASFLPSSIRWIGRWCSLMAQCPTTGPHTIVHSSAMRSFDCQRSRHDEPDRHSVVASRSLHRYHGEMKKPVRHRPLLADQTRSAPRHQEALLELHKRGKARCRRCDLPGCNQRHYPNMNRHRIPFSAEFSIEVVLPPSDPFPFRPTLFSCVEVTRKSLTGRATLACTSAAS